MEFGASLSVKQCRNFGVDDSGVLLFAVRELGITRFRLMSYWDEVEKEQGSYNFTYLDKQVRLIAKHKGTITLCLGARQPRWPESHWPEWAKHMPIAKRNQALYTFITNVVERYKDKDCIVSWQLENEALLKNFGEAGDFDRKRLRHEFALVKSLDDTRPVIMTTSTSWGIPLRRPIPDIVGFSLYRITHNGGSYRHSIYQPWIFKLRAWLIKLIWRRPSFIHELQAEPWGPKAIWEMPEQEQYRSMNPELLRANIEAALATKLGPVDLWGLEWWFWCKQHCQNNIWKAVKKNIK